MLMHPFDAQWNLTCATLQTTELPSLCLCRCFYACLSPLRFSILRNETKNTPSILLLSSGHTSPSHFSSTLQQLLALLMFHVSLFSLE